MTKKKKKKKIEKKKKKNYFIFFFFFFSMPQNEINRLQKEVNHQKNQTDQPKTDPSIPEKHPSDPSSKHSNPNLNPNPYSGEYDPSSPRGDDIEPLPNHHWATGFFECHLCNLSDWCSYLCPCYQCALNARALDPDASVSDGCEEGERRCRDCCPARLVDYFACRSALTDNFGFALIGFPIFLVSSPFVSCCCVPPWFHYDALYIPTHHKKALTSCPQRCKWWAFPCCGIARVAREIQSSPEYAKPNGAGRCCGANMCEGIPDLIHDLCCSCPVFFLCALTNMH